MPGLRHSSGPTIAAAPPGYGTYSLQSPEPTWDGRGAAAAMPGAHKACRPAHFHADWMKGTNAAANHSARKHCDDDDDELAYLVNDFIESGSSPMLDGYDSDSAPPSIAKICSTLQALTCSYEGVEEELLNAVRKLIVSIDVDADLICSSKGPDCRGGCIKRLVAAQLCAAGYDAAVCKSKWEGSGRVTLQGTVQMGEYEYIDVQVQSTEMERLIVDVDFQEQFVLARATHNHLSALHLLPTVFVGTTNRLEQILQIMSESVKLSLKENSMPLPPWRTLSFYHSKWLSPHERITNTSDSDSSKAAPWRHPHRHGKPSSSFSSSSTVLPSMPETRQCDVQLRRLKESLLPDVDHGVSMHVQAHGSAGRPSRIKRSSGSTNFSCEPYFSL